MSVMDLSGIVDTFATGVAAGYMVTRQPKRGFDNAGVVKPSPPSTFQIEASITPTGDDEEFQPKGNFSEDGIEIFTTSQLTTTSELYEPDSVTYKGRQYTVLHVEDYLDSAGYLRALAYTVRN